MIAELPRHGIFRHDAKPHLVRNDQYTLLLAGESGAKIGDFSRTIAAVMHEIAEPDGDAIDNDNLLFAGAQRSGEIKGSFDRVPAIASVGSVTVDPRPHLVIEGFGRGDIGPSSFQCPGLSLGEGGLAASRTAEDERLAVHLFTGGIRAMKCPRIASGHRRNDTSPVGLSP